MRNNELKKLMDVKIRKETAREKKENLPLEIHIEPLEHLPPPKGARQVRDGGNTTQEEAGRRKKAKDELLYTSYKEHGTRCPKAARIREQ